MGQDLNVHAPKGDRHGRGHRLPPVPFEVVEPSPRGLHLALHERTPGQMDGLSRHGEERWRATHIADPASRTRAKLQTAPMRNAGSG
ncbi:MAG: hypothetical protein Q7U96_05810 [Chloroflexota bacterium]|nr:hypothetical protein [Chloroflexota bacterium]